MNPVEADRSKILVICLNLTVLEGIKTPMVSIPTLTATSLLNERYGCPVSQLYHESCGGETYDPRLYALRP